jgi:hypothetical protein
MTGFVQWLSSNKQCPTRLACELSSFARRAGKHVSTVLHLSNVPNAKALMLSVTILLLASCSRNKSIAEDELRSQLTSATSFAAETAVLIDYIRQNRTTRKYARGHVDYLAQAVSRSAREIREAVPGEVNERKLQECQSELDSLANALSAVGLVLNNPTALAAAEQRIVTIRKALEKSKSSL